MVVQNNQTNIFKNKKILVIGGAGSIGTELIKTLIELEAHVVRVLDTNESGLFSLGQRLEAHESKIRLLLGDVRDKNRIIRASEDIDYIFNLAGLKHVVLSEYSPTESVKTNVDGVRNVIDAALINNVEKVIFTSSDKAANPRSVMGASKLLAERLMTSAHYYRGFKRTIFSSVRFGNVIGTRGSVIPIWLSQIKRNQPISVTDPNMTRFMMSKKSAVKLILNCARLSQGGEVFISKMPVVKIGDLAQAFLSLVENGTSYVVKGIREGEAIYEELMTEEEAQNALETQELFILPPHIQKLMEPQKPYEGAAKAQLFTYASKDQPLLSIEQITEGLIQTGIKKRIDKILEEARY